MHRSERFKSLREKYKLLFCSTKKKVQLLLMEAYPMKKRRQNKNTNTNKQNNCIRGSHLLIIIINNNIIIIIMIIIILFFSRTFHSQRDLPFFIDLDKSFSRGSSPQPLAQQSSSLSTELEGRWSHKSQKSQRLTLVPNLCRRGRRRNKGIVMSGLND